MMAATKQRFLGLRASIALLAMLGCVCAEAQVTRGDRMPEALKAVPPAIGACRRNDPTPLWSTPAKTTAVPPASMCTAATAEVAAQLALRGAALVDVRTAADYQAFHIAGALNAALSEVRSKPYWHDAPVVLVGNGKAEGELMAACAQMRQAGFKQLHVLRGGMPAWIGSGQPVLGNPPAVGQLMRLDVAGFLLENEDASNVMLLAAALANLRSDLRAASVLPEVSPRVIKSSLDHRPKPAAGRSPAVVLAVQSPVSDDQIAQWQRDLLPVPLLVYADGREAVTRQQKVQKAMWAAAERGPKPLGCGL